MKKRVTAIALVIAVFAIAVAGATLAYFTDTSEVAKNTFTVGDVQITLDEAEVDEYGNVISEKRVTENDYLLVPGHTYVKNPTTTVKEGSEPCYVRMLVTPSDMAKLTAAFPKETWPEFYSEDGKVFLLQCLVNGWDDATWTVDPAWAYKNGTYEFRYKDIVDARKAEQELAALFTEVKIPAEIEQTALAELQELDIEIVAQAIQADGFEDADAAWAEFK